MHTGRQRKVRRKARLHNEIFKGIWKAYSLGGTGTDGTMAGSELSVKMIRDAVVKMKLYPI